MKWILIQNKNIGFDNHSYEWNKF